MPADLFNRPVADAIAQAVHLKELHPEAVFLRILGVSYVHLPTADGGDLYVTRHGVPFLAHLQPENWYENEYFAARRERLKGTSTVYRIDTRPLVDQAVKSIPIVVKWSRVGQEVDLNTFTLARNLNAEFNTPFEEFALVEEMRRGEHGRRASRMLTQKPLAIYVPPRKLQPWQTGRSLERVLAKIALHPGVVIDVLRAYVLIYGWVKGYDAIDAFANSYHAMQAQQAQIAQLTRRVDLELRDGGYVVADHKPTHFILRLRNGMIRRRKDGRIVYALVDYELLSRTPEHENRVRAQRRSEYLTRQRDRFKPRDPAAYPPELSPQQIGGVSYVKGRCESTGGTLWVVGNDPELFGYFLPERWRGAPMRLSDTGQTFYTQTKDRVHLVWKVCDAGANDPFEQFALAMELAKAGVRVVYPRAIYKTADGDHISIWGYWRGVEDDDAVRDQMLWTPIDAAAAALKEVITLEQLEELMSRHRERLEAAGFADEAMRPDHVLLSHIPGGMLKLDADGKVETRQCNLARVRRTGAR